MSYFNPKIYNYKNLHDSDKKIIDVYDFAIEDMKTAIANLLEEEFECENTLEKIRKEIEEEFSKELLEFMESSRLEQLVSIIDDYEEDIEEVEE